MLTFHLFFFFFSSRRRHTRSCLVSWARRCVQETGIKLGIIQWQEYLLINHFISMQKLASSFRLPDISNALRFSLSSEVDSNAFLKGFENELANPMHVLTCSFSTSAKPLHLIKL
eukprot:TRINITY_DN7758_c0_g1_i3.p2 TRINITY_DN7758_c0_g1~~TRINITY_DN7758_c0_g1_i3.p2  ORF type:complete len:115 (+),score=24.57 TRINITY_DN7758_c0_g1_i3:3-347(+)